MLLYENFYRMHGLRRAAQLLNPPLQSLETFTFPRNSVVHYSSNTPTILGPDNNEYIFRSINRPIMMDNIITYSTQPVRGNPRHVSTSPTKIVDDYFRKHRRYKKLHNFTAATRDESNLVVFNYSVLNVMYRYQRSYYADYFKWYNMECSVWDEIAKITELSNRNHFLIYNLPATLPSVSQIKSSLSGTVNQKFVKTFNSPEKLIILEIWKWLGADRQSSILSRVPTTKVGLVNFVFQESSRWFVVNLGMLNSWRAPTEEELAIDPTLSKKGIEPAMLEKRFLRLMMSVMQARSVVAPEVKDAVNLVKTEDIPIDTVNANGELPDKTILSATDTTKPDDAFFLDEDDIAKEQIVYINGKSIKRNATSNIVLHNEIKQQEETLLPNDTKDTLVHSDVLNSKIDEDLQELETIAHITERETEQLVAGAEDEPVEEAQHHPVENIRSYESGVMKACDRLAADGMISAAEYNRYNKLANSYKKIVSPDGVTTLEHFVKIPPEKLTITESPTIPDIPTVIDKSMLKSSLLDFNERYVRDVLQKDVAAMVMHIQHAGIAVTEYEVENVDDIMGSYGMYTARVVPVEGVGSTLRFKLPVVDEDGVYRSNNTKYRLRLQRGDRNFSSI